ncbi:MULTISPECIES: fimbrial protein [Pseudomonadaceae]|uniref:fimbrial protein n=1 Tax=Pseudomonadaceae TaxID=135621 RepID=UPI0013F5D62C|nr:MULTISPECIES: fimbrial protein [Pseudomonas]
MNLPPRLFASALMLLLTSGTVWGANCTGSAKTNQLPLPSTLTVHRDVPIGTVLYDTGRWVGGGSASVTCTGPGEPWMDHGYRGAMTPTSLQHVYESGVPGVGIKVAWANNSSRPPATMGGGIFMDYPRRGMPILATSYSPAQLWWFQLIKTGPIESGTFGINPIQVYYHNMLTNELTFPPTRLVFNKTGCRLLNPAVTVHLPTANHHHFKGVGSSAWERAFDIHLECDPDVSISYRVDGTQAADSVLKNSEGPGMATGVGVQLLKGAGGGTPLVLGVKAYHQTSGPSGGPSPIPLIARYHQHEPDITPGAVVTTATLTLFYE